LSDPVREGLKYKIMSRWIFKAQPLKKIHFNNIIKPQPLKKHGPESLAINPLGV
jgi:hypothetical protein